MSNGTAWWRAARTALLADLSDADAPDLVSLPMLLQRLVMVAMQGQHPTGSPEACWAAATAAATPYPLMDVHLVTDERGAQVPAALHKQAALMLRRMFFVDDDDGGEEGGDGGGGGGHGHPCDAACADLILPGLGGARYSLEAWGRVGRLGARAEGGVPDDADPRGLAALCYSASCSLGLPPARADYFLLLVHALMGARPVTAEFLTSLLRSPCAPYLWPGLREGLLEDRPRLNLCHALEELLRAEAPELAAAFRAAGCSAGHAASRWLAACFVGYLRADDAVSVMAAGLVLGPELLPVVCCAVLRGMQARLLEAASEGALLQALACARGLGFRLQDHMHDITDMYSRHQAEVRAILANTAGFGS